MDSMIKSIVKRRLKDSTGKLVRISHKDWEKAKQDAMNDIYVNRLCVLKDIKAEYFINTIMKILITK